MMTDKKQEPPIFIGAFLILYGFWNKKMKENKSLSVSELKNILNISGEFFSVSYYKEL